MNVNTIVYLILIFPFLKPDSFRRIAMLDLAFDAMSLLCAATILVWGVVRLFQRKWKPSLGFGLILLLNVVLQASTLINSGLQISMLKNLLFILAVTVYIDTFMRDYRNLITALMTAFEILLYANFATFLLFPHGMYTDGLYSTNWLMGYDNSQIKFYICAVIVAYIYSLITKNKIRGYCLIGIVALSVLFTGVFSALIGLAIVIFTVFFSWKSKKNRIFNSKTYFIISLASFVIIVLLGALESIMTIITRYTGKNASLTTRFDIWNRTIDMAEGRYLIYGHGWQPTTTRQIEYMNPFATHAHDTYLEYLYQGGLIGVLVFLALLLVLVYKLSKCSIHNVKIFFSAVLFAFNMMMIFEAYVFPVVYMCYLLLYHCDKYEKNDLLSRLSRLLLNKKITKITIES